MSVKRDEVPDAPRIFVSGSVDELPDDSWQLLQLAFGLRIGLPSYLNYYASKIEPHAFDTSHRLLGYSHFSLRWDSVHYLSIALNGYEYEQQLAFLPGWPALMRLGGHAARWVAQTAFGSKIEEMGASDIVAAAGLFNQVASVAAVVMLYRLTRLLTRSSSFAYTTALFYLFLPTPVITSALYTEPIYALLTFGGFLLSAKKRWLAAAVVLALTSSVRSTGVFNIGVLGWHVLFGLGVPSRADLRPKKLVKRSLIAAPLCALVIAPFALFQYYGYLSFCLDAATARPWCTARVPMPYSFAQAQYWNVGFLTYWTPAQTPNYIIALPVLVVSLYGSYIYLRHLRQNYLGPATPLHKLTKPYSPSLLPFHIHHLVLTLLLIVNSHTQIALRVSMTDPVIWWNIAMLAFDWTPQPIRPEDLEEHRREARDTHAGGLRSMFRARKRMTWWGKSWLTWCAIWGCVSIVLWAGHYPPA